MLGNQIGPIRRVLAGSIYGSHQCLQGVQDQVAEEHRFRIGPGKIRRGISQGIDKNPLTGTRSKGFL
jgi:hypothetical protein